MKMLTSLYLCIIAYAVIFINFLQFRTKITADCDLAQTNHNLVGICAESDSVNNIPLDKVPIIEQHIMATAQTSKSTEKPMTPCGPLIFFKFLNLCFQARM